MLKMFAFFVALFLGIPSSSEAEQRQFRAPYRQIFVNTDCQETDTCDLLEFSIKVADYELKMPYTGELVYGTSMIVEYETTTLETLEKYALVNFLRGCMFVSAKHSNGVVANFFSDRKDQFGASKYFCFPDWAIDSTDDDPVYYSSYKSRHYMYKWNTVLGSFAKNTEKKYGEEKPSHPRLYISDPIANAWFANGEAKNISLEFKTCIYRAGDIPKKTTENDTNFATPIHCFFWKSSHVFNHATGQFESKNEIDSFCSVGPKEE